MFLPLGFSNINKYILYFYIVYLIGYSDEGRVGLLRLIPILNLKIFKPDYMNIPLYPFPLGSGIGFFIPQWEQIYVLINRNKKTYQDLTPFTLKYQDKCIAFAAEHLGPTLSNVI